MAAHFPFQDWIPRKWDVLSPHKGRPGKPQTKKCLAISNGLKGTRRNLKGLKGDVHFPCMETPHPLRPGRGDVLSTPSPTPPPPPKKKRTSKKTVSNSTKKASEPPSPLKTWIYGIGMSSPPHAKKKKKKTKTKKHVSNSKKKTTASLPPSCADVHFPVYGPFTPLPSSSSWWGSPGFWRCGPFGVW